MQNTEQQAGEAILHYIIHNQKQMQNLCSGLKDQYKALLSSEPVELHDDIKKDFQDLCMNVLITEIGKDLALDVGTIKGVIEDMDILTYLGV